MGAERDRISGGPYAKGLFFLTRTWDRAYPDISPDDVPGMVEHASHVLAAQCCWILYDQNFVLLGRGEQPLVQKLEKSPGTLRELRFFCRRGELYLWRHKSSLKARLRVDDEVSGQEVEVYRTHPFTWASHQGENDFRHIRLRIDHSLSGEPIDRYEAYNYFRYDRLGHIVFYDARLVQFTGPEGV